MFGPFPGFEPFEFYPGYSANFFDGEHYVMKGGSARTAGSMLRRSFRNWFQPHYQYVYAGFRCVRELMNHKGHFMLTHAITADPGLEFAAEVRAGLTQSRAKGIAFQISL